MLDVEKSHYSTSDDPEKVNGLAPTTTYADGEVVFKHADPNDGDDALKAFVGHDGEPITMTPEEEKRLLWKIDMNLMPVSSSINLDI